MSKHIEMDSVTLMNHSEKVNVAQRVAWEACERMEEHVEQTVFTFGTDTVGVEANGGIADQKMIFSVMKRVVDRGSVTGQRVGAERFSVCADSSVVVRTSVVKMDSREDKQRLRKWKVWKLAAVAGLVVLCVFLFKRFFSSLIINVFIVL